MITIPDLIKVTPDSVFAQGEAIIPEVHSEPLKWVAVRGGIHDWAIYCHFATESFEQVRIGGDKIKTKSVIKRLVPCSDDALGMYRL